MRLWLAVVVVTVTVWTVDTRLNTPTGYYSATITAWATLPSSG